MSCSRRTALDTDISGGGSTALFRNSATLLCVKLPPSSIFTCTFAHKLQALTQLCSGCASMRSSIPMLHRAHFHIGQ